MSTNCDATVIFPIYDQFGAISLAVTFRITKTENKTKLSYYAFE